MKEVRHYVFLVTNSSTVDVACFEFEADAKEYIRFEVNHHGFVPDDFQTKKLLVRESATKSYGLEEQP